MVETRVAERLVARRESGLVDLLGTTQTLRDVITGELDVDAAGVRARRPVRLEEALDLVDDIIEPASLVRPLPCIGSVTQSGVASRPLMASRSGGSASRTLPAPMRVMNVRRPGSRSGSSLSMSCFIVSAVVEGPSLTPIGLRTREK